MEKDKLNLVNLEESCIFVIPQKHLNRERYFKNGILQTVGVVISIDTTLKLIKSTGRY